MPICRLCARAWVGQPPPRRDGRLGSQAPGALHRAPHGLGEDLPDILHQSPHRRRKNPAGDPNPRFDLWNDPEERNGAGLVLWVVPSSQIYRDTLRRLRDRGDMYRLMLEHAVSRRIEVWEKHEDRPIVACAAAGMPQYPGHATCQHQSGNQGTIEILPRQRREHRRAFPPENDAAAHKALKERVPNLEMLARGRFPRAMAGKNFDRQSRADLPPAGDFG